MTFKFKPTTNSPVVFVDHAFINIFQDQTPARPMSAPWLHHLEQDSFQTTTKESL